MNIKTERVVTLVYKAGVWVSLDEMMLLIEGLGALRTQLDTDSRFDTVEQTKVKKLLGEMIDLKKQANIEITAQGAVDKSNMPPVGEHDSMSNPTRDEKIAVSIKDINKEIANDMKSEAQESKERSDLFQEATGQPDCETCD